MSVIRKFLVLILLVTDIAAVFGQGFGERVNICSDWKFTLSNPKYAGAEFHDDSGWKRLDLPHDWSVEGQASENNASCTGFLPGGIGWYRKQLEIPVERKGQKVFIYFEGVYNNSEVYVNGKWIGKRPNGYVSFCYDITPYVNFGGRNVVAVSVDHSASADSRWYTGSGIYRDVWLVYAGNVHLDLWGVHYDTEIQDAGARLNVFADICNESDNDRPVKVLCTLTDSKGRKVAEKEVAVRSTAGDVVQAVLHMDVRKPELWSIDNPCLYTLSTEVLAEGTRVDGNTTTVGIRKLSFDPDKGFSLNGKNMKVKGVCLHHDAGALGAVVPEEVWTRRLSILKELGCNAIRMSHNPQSEALYSVCDRLGMLVMDEAFDEWEYPKKKWITGWNKGKPGFQGSSHYFREWNKVDLASMVKRDRNHPSIIMWSIGNEVDYPNDPYSHPVLDTEGISQIHEAGYKKTQPHANRLGEIAQELVAVVKKYDTSRPVTAALAGAVMSNETKYPYVLDVVGYNYTESRYVQDHRKYPERVLYGSENRHDLDAWKAVRDNDFIFGQFLWTGFDYLGESGPWPSRGFSSGLVDFVGEPKARGYFRQALWAETPVIHVGTCGAGTRPDNLSSAAKRVWNYEDGEKVKLVVYSNCEEVELLLDGRPYGKRQKYDDNTAVFSWDVQFREGRLTARGYNGGKKTIEDTVVSTGLPYSIDAKVYNDEAVAGKLIQLEITVLDGKGNIVTLADNEILCKVSGNARLVALDSGSNDVRDNYRDNRQRCHNGRLLAYLKAVRPGKVEVKLTSPLLKSRVLEFDVVE